MSPYRSSARPLLPPHPTPPRVGDMVRIVKNPQVSDASLYGNACTSHLVGTIGFVSMINEKVYMVTFITRGHTTGGFFFDNEIEVVKRNVVRQPDASEYDRSLSFFIRLREYFGKFIRDAVFCKRFF